MSEQKENRLWALFFFVVWNFYFWKITPTLIFNTEPATGGDTGSHFYSLYVLFNESLPHWSIRNWNPGHLFGEPHLVHYFPLPFLIMSLIGLFSPLGQAFNIGTILPVYTFPIAVFYAMRRTGLSSLQSLVVTSFTLLFLFNESYAIWGGNANSLLAGQFAHLYALNFLFLFWGRLQNELAQQKTFIGSALLAACVALSHAYIFLMLPFLMLAALWLHPKLNFKMRLKHLVGTGLFSLGFIAWHLGPQIQNQKVVTSVPLRWSFTDFVKEIFPPNILFASGLLAFGLPVLTYLLGRKKSLEMPALRLIGPWVIFYLASWLFFLVLPKLGLIDVRALPQGLLAITVITGLVAAFALSQVQAQSQSLIALMLIFSVGLFSFNRVVNYTAWIKWNYSSWSQKTLYKESQKVFEFLKSDFSKGRVVSEHHPDLNKTGSPRVWEMLPYFSRKSTLESLYAEATFTAPLTYLTQSMISDKPSCPLAQWSCSRLKFDGLKDKLHVLGVNEIILFSEVAKNSAKEHPQDFELAFSSPPFEVYRLKELSSLVEVPVVAPEPYVGSQLQRDFYDWYYYFEKDRRPLITNWNLQLAAQFSQPQTELANCKPEVAVKFGEIKLFTNCPNHLHVLKFTYHPTWQSNHGEEISIISPGFMAFTPTQSETILTFGQSWVWTLSRWVTALFALMSIGILVRKRYFKNSTKI